ncbi:MAG: YifB family Mg chelatase-like AAA ATPase [Longimicrobiales bacterium]|nr:YifB family Mg chelatase-like AAA ATPase [Longimicrobiales bacterium]
MLAHVTTAALHGVDALPVRVEVSITSGLPVFSVVGLPRSEVREGRERVAAALRHIGVELPPRRITVNLSPADVRKEGSGFDLPLAVVLMVAAGRLPASCVAEWAFVGEVGLDGEIRPARGVLPRVLALAAAGVRGIVVPPANLREASAVRGVRVETAGNLSALAHALESGAWPSGVREPRGVPRAEAPDLADLRGQRLARRALEVAVAGGHNLLLIGPPGTGKTLLARRIPGLLPPLSEARALEVTRIHSVAGVLPEGSGLVELPPFRAPHHGVSEAGLVGGGRPLRPGEFSLAHHGVLFLDELAEFRRNALEALRQPMEEGRVRLTRAHGTVVFPARPMVVAAMNPCPCGRRGSDDLRHGSEDVGCTCTPERVTRYLSRVSGPLLDRFDLHIVLGRVPIEALEGPGGEASASVRGRVTAARRVQGERLGEAGIETNAEMDVATLRHHVEVAPGTAELLQAAHGRLGFSARGYHRILRVARTIADLAGSSRVRPEHAAEALHFRELDRPAEAVASG